MNYVLKPDTAEGTTCGNVHVQRSGGEATPGPEPVRIAIGVLVGWLREADKALAELDDEQLSKWFALPPPGSTGPMGDVLAAFVASYGTGVISDAPRGRARRRR